MSESMPSVGREMQAAIKRVKAALDADGWVLATEEQRREWVTNGILPGQSARLVAGVGLMLKNEFAANNEEYQDFS